MVLNVDWLSRLKAAFVPNYWASDTPHPMPLVFMNTTMALRQDVLGHQSTDGYRQACGFFKTALFDRTNTLNSGLALETHSPIPMDGINPGTMDQICDARGEELVAEARRRQLPLRLLWSGGIDSSAAYASLMKALGNETDLLEIAYSRHSTEEYPLLFQTIKEHRHKLIKFARIDNAFGQNALIVTGEHGDQIFGSMLAADLRVKEYYRDWPKPIQRLFRRVLKKDDTNLALHALDQQRRACPIPIESAFDLLWWWNFSMKWQCVSQRMIAPQPDSQRALLQPRLRHFFDTQDFQRWSLANPDKRVRETWASYKWPLKDYLYDYTKDARYRDRKKKERSLRGVFDHRANTPFAIDSSGRKLEQRFDHSLRDKWGFSISTTYGE